MFVNFSVSDLNNMFDKLSIGDNSMVIMHINLIVTRSCYDDHGQFYNIVWTIIIQPTLQISVQVVVQYFYYEEYVGGTHQKLPEKLLLKWICSSKKSKRPKIVKSCNIWVISKLSTLALAGQYFDYLDWNCNSNAICTGVLFQHPQRNS